MKLQRVALLVALVALVKSSSIVGAVPVPIVDPGFDVYLPGTTTPIPDQRATLNFTQGGTGSGPQTNAQLIKSNGGPTPTPEFGDIPAGWTAFSPQAMITPATGRFKSVTEFDNPELRSTMAYTVTTASDSDPGAPSGFTQTLAGVKLLADTTYTLTIQVSDPDTRRNLDNLGAPNIDLTKATPTDKMHLVLLAGAVDLGGSPSFVGPGNGETTVFTRTITTGADVSQMQDDLVIQFWVDPYRPQLPDSAFPFTSRTFFDNVTLDAVSDAPDVDADFDQDGDVDGADFLIWQRGLGLNGQISNSNGDADDSGEVDGLDLAVWRAEFGMPQAAVAAAVIPEPASGALWTIALASGLAACQRRGRRATLTRSR